MKRLNLAFLLAGVSFTFLVNAAPIEWEPVGSGKSTYRTENYYESAGGNRYQYNLSNPVDQIRYEYDRPAQIRDAYNPRTNMDRGMGQYGGGIYDDDYDH